MNTAIGKYLLNPFVKAAFALGVAPPGVALLETTGCKTGQPRRTPIGRCLDGDTFWIVAEHGRKAAYVHNIQADPRVRLKIGRRWRTGTAHPMPDDDPIARQLKMGKRGNAAVVRMMGTDLMTVRIELDRPPISS